MGRGTRMSVAPEILRDIFGEYLLEAAERRERREHLKPIKGRHKDDGIDWSQLRALAVAHDADQHDKSKEPKKYVAALLDKRGYAELYADIVFRLHVPEQIHENHSSSPAANARAAGIERPLQQPEPSRADKERGAGPAATTNRPADQGNPKGNNPSAPATLADNESVADPPVSNGDGACSPISIPPRTPDGIAPSTISDDDPYNRTPSFLDRTKELVV